MTKHTPIPCGTLGEKANAKHIVHCVNMHDELVGALDGITILAIMAKSGGLATQHEKDKWLNDIKDISLNALKKARGEI